MNDKVKIYSGDFSEKKHKITFDLGDGWSTVLGSDNITELRYLMDQYLDIYNEDKTKRETQVKLYNELKG